MAYTSLRGRKPIERASKIAHAEIINNPVVKAYLEECAIPKPAAPNVVASNVVPVPPAATNRINTVIAIDGGYREVAVREEYPSASITFFTFGPLLFRLSDLRELDESPFIAPEDLARLKTIQRYSLVLPTKQVSRRGLTLQRSIRDTLQEFFLARPTQDPPLMAALRWLLFEEWWPEGGRCWLLPRCPNAGCDEREIVLSPEGPDEMPCPGCGEPIYIIDALRLHERVDEEQGAGGILSYTLTTLEQLVLVHLIKAIWELRPTLLREVLFIKDGPLAFFGQTAPLSQPMRQLTHFLMDQPDPTGPSGARTSLLNVVGLEKSGAFVEHAAQIEDRLPLGTLLPLSSEYIFRYILPGPLDRSRPYGSNTYWGGKLIYRANDGNIYVATVPRCGDESAPTVEDFSNLDEILAVVGRLRCSMYDNALIPVALANKLVSLSEFPSARILENFARQGVA